MENCSENIYVKTIAKELIQYILGTEFKLQAFSASS